jgi:protease IV
MACMHPFLPPTILTDAPPAVAARGSSPQEGPRNASVGAGGPRFVPATNFRPQAKLEAAGRLSWPGSERKGRVCMNTAMPGQQPIVIYHQMSPISRLWGWLGWFLAGIFLLMMLGAFSAYSEYLDEDKGITEKFVSGSKKADDKIAIISIEGVIMDGDGFVKKQIDRIREDKKVKAVVVRVDSPGGTVSGSDYILHHLNKLREEKNLPIVVSMGSMAASGGYYVSMAVGDQENSIYAEPTTTTGSIGVIIPHYDISGLLAEYNVKDDSIATGDRKQMLSMTRPITPEHRELIQSYVNESFARFKSIIKQGRPVFQKDESALDQLATGEIFSAHQALKHGLVDKIGFQEDAIDRAIELASLDKKKVKVIKFDPPVDVLGSLGLSSSKSGAFARPFDAQSLLELSTPRAYYLVTMLPGMTSAMKE